MTSHHSSFFAEYFGEYAEPVPDGTSCKALSEMARDNSVHLVGGSIPERAGDTLYNTATVWAPDGSMVAKHRKVSGVSTPYSVCCSLLRQSS